MGRTCRGDEAVPAELDVLSADSPLTFCQLRSQISWLYLSRDWEIRDG